ncbi:MAG: ATP-binding protein [Acidobacteriota bacterium]|nr:ATP-binding protein [Acidobacteriota bacterium]
MELEAIDFELEAIVQDVIKLLGVRTHGKGLSLTCSIAPDVPKRLIGDPTRLRQILCNLMGNAVKFTERGEVGANVEVESRTATGICLHFAIHDTGIGIAQHALEKIFEAFTQEDNSTSRKHGGTGLGFDYVTTGRADERAYLASKRSGPGQYLPLHRRLQIAQRACHRAMLKRVPAGRRRSETCVTVASPVVAVFCGSPLSLLRDRCSRK